MTRSGYPPGAAAIAACCFAILRFVVGPPAAADPWEPIPADAWQQLARPDSGGRNAIVLTELGVVEDREGEFKFNLYRRLRVFTERGRDAGKVEIDYLKGRRKVRGIQARSVRPDGMITELAADQILTSTIVKSGGVEYYRASFIVPGIEPGCIVEYRYAIEGKREGFWIWPWYFQNEYYTRESRFRWRPSEWRDPTFSRPSWTFRKIAESRAGLACTPDCERPKEVSFSAYAIPGAKEEDWAPPIREAGPRVITSYTARTMTPLQFWSLWKDALDRIATKFSKDMGSLGGVVKDAQRRRPDSEAALDEVHDWLRTNVRSTAERSWKELQVDRKDQSFWGKESSVADLIEHRSGSPYEINLAFAAAARMLGFEAKVVLVRDRREGSFDANLMGWLPSEAITVVQANGSRRKRYFNPASRFAIADNVPWYLRGGSGLVAGSGSEMVIGVDADAGVPGESHWQLDLSLDPSGEIAGNITGSTHGEMARSYRAMLWPKDPGRWAKVLAEELAPDHSPELELEVGDLTATPDSAFQIRGGARYPGMATVSGSLVSVPVSKLVPWRLRAEFEGDRRSQPVFFDYPRLEEVSVDLRLPQGAVLEELPAPRSFQNGIGEWRTEWSRTSNGVRFERTVRVRYSELPPQDYKWARELFAGLAEADRELLLIRSP